MLANPNRFLSNIQFGDNQPALGNFPTPPVNQQQQQPVCCGETLMTSFFIKKTLFLAMLALLGTLVQSLLIISSRFGIVSPNLNLLAAKQPNDPDEYRQRPL